MSIQSASVGLLLLLLLAACQWAEPVINVVPLEGEDPSARSLRLYAAHPLLDGAGERTGRFVGVSVVADSGEFDDRITAGQGVRLRNTLITGPADLQADFDFSRSSVFLAWSSQDAEHMTWTGLAGLSATNLDMRLQSGAVTDTIDTLSIGPMFGVQAQVPVVPKLEAFAKLEWHFGVLQEDLHFQAIFESGLNWRLGSSAGLSAGWQLSDYQLDRDSDNRSDVELSYSGPFFAVSLAH